MTIKSKKALRVVIPLILALAFGWYMFSKFPLSEVIPYFRSANYFWIILGAFLGFFSHISRAYRWQYLLEPMGYNIKLPNSIMAVFITYLANYGVPRSGEVLRAAVLTNYENVPFEKSFGTIVAERMADLIMLLLIIIITLIIQFDFIYTLLEKSFEPEKLIILLFISGLLLVLLYIYIKRSTSKFANKIRSFISGLVEGMLSIFKMKKKWHFVFHTFFIWLMYVLMFYVTTFALPELNNITIGAILIAFIVASFTIATTNGGLFFYPAAILGALTLFNLPENPSYAFGWIMWTAQTIMVGIFGTISFIYLPIYNRKKGQV